MSVVLGRDDFLILDSGCFQIVVGTVVVSGESPVFHLEESDNFVKVKSQYHVVADYHDTGRTVLEMTPEFVGFWRHLGDDENVN